MRILFFDTETTGRYNFKSHTRDPEQPHIIQIAGRFDQNEKPQASFNLYINLPDDVIIEPGAEQIHGISKDFLKDNGNDLKLVMATVNNLAQMADLIVCHNTDFDLKMFDRDCLFSNEPNFMHTKESYCTMKAATPICKLPNPRYPGQYKWPKLEEAYGYFFGGQTFNAHDAAEDVRVTSDIFYALQRVGNSAD